MASFNPGDKVVAYVPQFSSSELPGVVLLNDLKGPHPLLVKLTIGDKEMCIQSDADGSGTIRHADAKADEGLKVVSYLFADGTATPFRDAEQPRTSHRPSIGVMKAVKLADGSYTGHEFVKIETKEPTAAPFNGASLKDILDGFFKAPR